MLTVKRRRGFTLIELMIVIAIIAILADILIPNFFRARALSFLSTCESNEKNIGTGIEMYSVDNQGHYPATFVQLTPNYLHVIPTCPSISTDSYSGDFTSIGPLTTGDSIDAYSFYCANSRHVFLGLTTGFPQYNSQQGLVTGK